jgi:selenide, water dikinase
MKKSLVKNYLMHLEPMSETQKINLTAFSKGSGCGCKIAPDVLQKILKASSGKSISAQLLVGRETFDDAAVYDLGNGMALISTVDFFTPVVNDAFDFGRIAAANAISDVYAMGGKPLFANAILGWPVDKLSPEMAGEVLKGAESICTKAGISIAGGHSIDAAEPFFGLSVNGIASAGNIKKNSSALKGDLIYLTKPLGSGILSAALKREKITEDHKAELIGIITQLNSFGEAAGKLHAVHALTDVTGFGLLGHLIEMAEGSALSAEIDYSKIRMMNGLKEYFSQMIVPDNLYRNWNSYEKKVKGIGPESFFTLSDPQTNGGLLLAVSPEFKGDFEKLLLESDLAEYTEPIGYFTEKAEKPVEIKNG